MKDKFLKENFSETVGIIKLNGISPILNPKPDTTNTIPRLKTKGLISFDEKYFPIAV